MRQLFLLLLLGTLAGPALARAAPLVSDEPPAAVQQRVLELVNQARARGRVCGTERFAPAAPLQISDALFRAARSHARDMARRNYFEHASRDGRTPKDRVQAEGYRLRLTGENIAFGPETAAEVVAGWLGSPGHCANMMDPRFVDMGAAVAKGRKRGHFYWVQEFGMPADPATRRGY
jgi:uncharacterized protein YkwD